MPAYPVTNKEILGEIVENMMEGQIESYATEHEWLGTGFVVLSFVDGRQFLLQVSEVQQ